MPLRSADAAFLAAVDAWWGALLPQLAPLTYERGGPIAMVQVGGRHTGLAAHPCAYLWHAVHPAFGAGLLSLSFWRTEPVTLCGVLRSIDM